VGDGLLDDDGLLVPDGEGDGDGFAFSAASARVIASANLCCAVP
jgi:hypothetical protein